MTNTQPIGILDSGVGGLTVVKEVHRQLPNEAIVYIGDSARAPYGVRSNEEIHRFTWEMVNFLLSKDVKMIVFACNTATAVALDDVAEKVKVPVIGVITPGATAAIQKSEGSRIGIIGTPATVKSDIYANTIQAKSSGFNVISLACPDFVPLVESGNFLSAESVVAESLSPLKGEIDTLILGCTHYPLLKKEIGEFMGCDVKLIDSGRETVRDISVLLNYFNIDSPENPTASQLYYTTGQVTRFDSIASQFLGQAVAAQQVVI